MLDGQINYETYTDLELREAAISIDRERFPLNYRNLTATIAARELDASRPAEPLAGPVSIDAPSEMEQFEERLLTLTPRTPVTYALIAINVVVFAAMIVAGAGVFEPNARVHVLWGSNLVPVTVDGEWWRLATSMFLHFGIVHLLVNMWVLYSNGRMVERLFGSTRFLILYLVAGVCGSLASAAWNPAVNSAGASGAIFGVLGGLGSFLVAKRFRVPREVIRAQSKSVGAFVLFNVFNGLAHQGIDNAAHLGGLVGGFLIGLALARPMTVEARDLPDERYVINVVGTATCCLVVSAVLVGFVRSRHSAENRFMAAVVWFDYREPQVMATYNAMVEASKAADLSDQRFAQRLGAEVVPFYSMAVERLAWAPTAPGPFDEARGSILKYVSLRQESMTLLGHALRASDVAQATAAMKLHDQAEQVRAQLVAAPMPGT
jgi:rhomboid protease GluP